MRIPLAVVAVSCVSLLLAGCGSVDNIRQVPGGLAGDVTWFPDPDAFSDQVQEDGEGFLELALVNCFDEPAILPSSVDIFGVVGEPITTTSAFEVFNLVAPITYSIDPSDDDLPDGLTLNLLTGAISGTPDAGEDGSYTVTIIATDANSDTATATVNILIQPNDQARLTPSRVELFGVVGVEVTPTAAFIATGFTGTVVYSIDPALPPNLTLNTATGVISGTANNVVDYVEYEITATAGTDTVTASVFIDIVPVDNSGTPYAFAGFLFFTEDLSALYDEQGFLCEDSLEGTVQNNLFEEIDYDASSFSVQFPDDQSFCGLYAVGFAERGFSEDGPQIIPIDSLFGVVGEEVTPTSGFVELGFAGPVTYSADDPLPAGLSLDPGTGVISGTPTEPTEGADDFFAITATDDQGNTATTSIFIQIVVAVGDPDDEDGGGDTGLNKFAIAELNYIAANFEFFGPIDCSSSPRRGSGESAAAFASLAATGPGGLLTGLGVAAALVLGGAGLVGARRRRVSAE
jgi:hypothetical protein